MADGSGAIRFDWADGEHVFRLALAQLRELQDRTGVGPQALADRLAGRDWRIDDLRETIRLGLIGGGMDPLDALARVRTYVDARPLLESVYPAWRIVNAALMGPTDDQPGKKEAPPPAATTEADGPSAASSEPGS
jgi:hypothetical protein